MYDKLKVFDSELDHIENPVVKKFTEKVISNMPDYFFETAASSTGKYHPRYALGNGGLVRHTKAAVSIAIDLLSLEHNTQIFSQDEKDCIISALICHDGWKHGDTYSKYTVANHPVVAAEHILEFADDNERDFAKAISDNISSHMGQWNTDYKSGKEIMPKPQTPSEMFVHECDYLASRKYLEYQFDKLYNPDSYKEEKTSELETKISDLISLCKDKISKGVDREELYRIIAENNGGKKNPNTITEAKVVQKIFNIINKIKEND